MSSSVYCFSVHADASPSALPRIVEVFALHNHVLSRCHAQLAGPAGGEELVVDLQMAGVSQHEAMLLAKRLGRVVSVRNVLWSEKRAAVAMPTAA